MAVRTSQTPYGRASQSDFDQLLRQEITRSRGRGGETDTQGARDRVAKRLNAQEGRSRNSSAYRPSRGDTSARGKSNRHGPCGRGDDRGDGAAGRGTSGAGAKGTPVPQPRPQTGNPWDEMNKYPAPDGVTAAPGGDNAPWWLIPLLAGTSAGTGAYVSSRMRRGPEPEFTPPGPRPAPVPTEPIAIDSMPTATQLLPGQPQLPPPVRQLPYAPAASPIDEVMSESDVNPRRYMSPEEIARAQAGAEPINAMVEGTGSMYSPAMRGVQDMNLPPLGSRAPGFYKPILRVNP